MASSSSTKKLIPTSHLIPEHVIRDEILTRLPVKSLCRFKCISKPWCSLISSERFVKLHLLLYSTNFPRILMNIRRPHDYLMHCPTRSLFSKNFVTEATHTDFKDSEYKMVIGSSNGIICLFVGHFQEFDFFLWNPSTRKHMQLPSPNVGDMAWAEFGFSYDPSKNEYVLLLISFIGTGDFLSKLYRSSTNSWKIIGNCDFGYPAYTGKHCKFVAGNFHIPICPDDSFNYEEDDFAVIFDIISFDLDKEEYGVIKHPDYGDGVGELSLEELGGNLCVLCNKETQADLWVMKEYGDIESWTKTVTIRYNFFYLKPLIVSQSREMLLLHKVEGIFQNDRKFVVYDLNKNTQRVPQISNVGNFGEADVYVESLVCPNMALVE